MFSECFSGGILDDIFTVSTDEPNESYHGNAHFYGAAATNHYEQSWTGWDETGVYYGAAQGFTAAMSADGGGVITNECYEYMIAHNSFVAVERDI